MLPEFFAGQVKFINLAVSARSSKSFRTEGRWREALAFKPDYIFIQFGHNDCPGKGLHRETDPNTTYADNLRQYIQEARAIHAVPILVTPMERRVFKPDGRRIALSLKAYAEAVRRVAKETQTPVIDLHRRSVELFERLGDKGGMVLNSTPGDRTHFSEKGARLLASFIVEDLSVSELKQWVMPKPKLKTKSK